MQPSPVSAVSENGRKRGRIVEETQNKQQKSLHYFNFHCDVTNKKGVTHRCDAVVAPHSDPIKLYPCPHCPREFNHAPGLASHVKTHKVLGVDLVEPTQHRLDGLGIAFNIPTLKHDDRYRDIPTDVRLCLRDIILAVEKENASRKVGSRGAGQRKRYSFFFKARVLTALADKTRYQASLSDYILARRFNIHKTILSKWLKNSDLIFETAKQLRNDASKQLRIAKQQQKQRKKKYAVMELHLMNEFDAARALGKRCGPQWLLRNGRRLLKVAFYYNSV